MPTPNEIRAQILFLYEEWMSRPKLQFPELLDAIRVTDKADSPLKKIDLPEVDWAPTKAVLMKSLQSLGYPAAQLMKDYCGTEYWEEGYRFQVTDDGLQLFYLSGLDISEEAVKRCSYRQEVCNKLLYRLYCIVTGKQW